MWGELDALLWLFCVLANLRVLQVPSGGLPRAYCLLYPFHCLRYPPVPAIRRHWASFTAVSPRFLAIRRPLPPVSLRTSTHHFPSQQPNPSHLSCTRRLYTAIHPPLLPFPLHRHFLPFTTAFPSACFGHLNGPPFSHSPSIPLFTAIPPPFIAISRRSWRALTAMRRVSRSLSLVHLYSWPFTFIDPSLPLP
jgi:hypothetical protein